MSTETDCPGCSRSSALTHPIIMAPCRLAQLQRPPSSDFQCIRAAARHLSAGIEVLRIHAYDGGLQEGLQWYVDPRVEPGFRVLPVLKATLVLSSRDPQDITARRMSLQREFPLLPQHSFARRHQEWKNDCSVDPAHDRCSRTSKETPCLNGLHPSDVKHRHYLFCNRNRHSGHLAYIGDRHLVELGKQHKGFTVPRCLVMVLPIVAEAIPAFV